MDTSESLNGRLKNNHPDFKNILKLMNECNIIKFAGYRTAAKLRVLQRVLHVDTIKLNVIAGVFIRHHLEVTENGVCLKYSELEDVIFDIFFAAKRDILSSIDVDSATDLMLNFLHNVYDRHTSGAVEVLSVKMVLVVLCSAQLREKYEYIFRQLTDHNNCISPSKLEKLLNSLTYICVFLNESTAFGFEHIPAAIESCFQQSHGTLGITEDMFIGWLLHEPQILTWFPTLHRMQIAEMVTHNVKCNSCKVYPVNGLRYKCLDCLRYNLCQTCFFTGRTSKRHKLTHPVQEYCYESSSRDSTFAFLKMLKNKLCGSSSQLQYLSVQPHDETFETDCSESQEEVVVIPATEAVSHPHAELQNIISRLEQENRVLRQTVEKISKCEGTSDVCKELREHHILIDAQVERLKKLKHCFSRLNLQDSYRPVHLQSTPVSRNTESLSLANISPILQEDDVNKLSTGMQELKLLTWQLKQERQSTDTLSDVSTRDLSTWVAERVVERVPDPSGFSTWVQDPSSKHKLEELDTILEKLQDMLASNFSLEGKT